MDTTKNLIADSKQKIFIVIDALDEFPLLQRPKLLDILEQLCNGANSNIHILVASRPEPDISSKLNRIKRDTIDIEHRAKCDIRLFVQAAIKEISVCNNHEVLNVHQPTWKVLKGTLLENVRVDA